MKYIRLNNLKFSLRNEAIKKAELPRSGFSRCRFNQNLKFLYKNDEKLTNSQEIIKTETNYVISNKSLIISNDNSNLTNLKNNSKTLENRNKISETSDNSNLIS